MTPRPSIRTIFTVPLRSRKPKFSTFILIFNFFFRSLLTGGLGAMGTSGAGSASGAGASGAGASGSGMAPGGMGCNCNCNYNQVSPAASATGRGYDSYGPGYG